MRKLKQAAIYALLVAVFLGVLGIPALIAGIGEWISTWQWPKRFIERLERIAEKHGVDL